MCLLSIFCIYKALNIMVKANNRQTTGSIFASKLEGREFGKYRAEKLITRHEFRQTITLLATNKETKEQVVLKAFGSFSVKSQKEFEKEITAFTKLKSKHGVLIPLETFKYEGDYFIVTEYKNGGDLRGWLDKKPKVSETLDIFTRIAESIDYVHENKIIHRDIKPENVVYEVVNGRLTPFLMDFGISVTLSNTTSSFETKSQIGTIEYMAPEFFLDVDAKKTKAIDIYAFGLMLYEALEGRHPFLGSTQQETMAQIVSGIVPVPKNTIKRLGENAGLILVKALSKNPKERPETASEIIMQVGSQYTKYAGKTYGAYIIEEYLGQGLYGATCKAHGSNKKTKKFTIKLLSVPQTKEPEIGDLKGLDHDKGILPIVDAGYANGTQYLISEYINGDNLRHVLSARNMEILDILKMLKSVSKTLDYLHERGIFHCNLKPENILLEKNGAEENSRPFISDYGVAQIIETTDAVNASGSVLLGSLGYLAPEVLEGGKLSPAADVYSLGVIIYEAIEGKAPFDAKSLPALIKQKLEGNVPIPENLLKSAGIRAVSALLKALSIKPGKRQRSASDLVTQIENAIKNRGFIDREAFIKPWISSHKLLSDFKKVPYAPWASMAVLFLVSWGIYSSLYTRHTPAPIATSTNTPTATLTSTITHTFTPSTTPIPSPTSTPTFVLSDQCKLTAAPSSQDYPVPGHLLLSEVYEQEFNEEHVSNDMYAIAYYNNRKILEGYSKYHVIDPIGLDVRKDWTIFIPPQDWIDAYKQFPSTIPFPIPEDSQSEFEISGSSVLSRLSAQISKCSAEIIKTKLVQKNSGTTDSGLHDLCQSKADLFGASKEIDPRSSCVELEKFEVAKYAMVIFIHKDNPIVDDIQKNPLTHEELANLLTGASSWENIREYWENGELITRYYVPLESGEFEIVQDGIFPNKLVFDPGQLNIYHDGQSLIDAATKDVNAVGIVDYASYQRCENKNQLIAIPVNGVYAGSAIANNDSRYPLMTTLYLYAAKHSYEENATLRSFINYYLSHEFDFLEDLGYLYPSKKGYTGNRDTVP